MTDYVDVTVRLTRKERDVFKIKFGASDREKRMMTDSIHKFRLACVGRPNVQKTGIECIRGKHYKCNGNDSRCECECHNEA